MTGVKTYGRWPTVEEVMEYYSRSDILSFLYEICMRRRVAFVFPTALRWEPDWRRDRVRIGREGELLRFLEKRVYGRLGRDGLNRRLDFYPSFHMDVRRYDPPFSDREQDLAAFDFLFEADSDSWRRGFEDVTGILAVLDRFEVPYLLKFSGHRSLHLMIRGEAFLEPENHRGFIRPLDEVDALLKRLVAVNRSRAHKTGITRVPYSLSEDTGLVCLPLHMDELDGFRPWHANIHAVEEVDAHGLEPSGGTYGRGKALLEALSASEEGKDVVGSKRRLRGAPKDSDGPVQVLRGRSVEQCLEDLRSPDERRRVQGARALMMTEEVVPPEELRDGMKADHPDVRWFLVEAIGRRSFPGKLENVARLAGDRDRYVHEAVIRLFDDLGDRAIPVLEDLFRTEAFRIKKGALRALTELGDPGAILKALGVAEGTDLGVSDPERAHLLVQFLNVGDAEARALRLNDRVCPPLLAVAEHAAPAFAELIGEKDDLWGWTSTHRALVDGLLNNEAFVGNLIPLVSAMLDDEDLPRLNRALWWMRWISGVPCCEKLLEQDQTLAEDLVSRLQSLQRHPKKSIRRAVVSVLCGIPSRKAIALAADMLDDPAESVRRTAASRLRRAANRYPEALEALIRRLQRERKTPVKMRILWSLSDHQALPRAVEGLFIALNDSNRRTRLQALDALADTDQAMEAIQIALTDRSLKVQRRAKALLEAQKAGERKGVFPDSGSEKARERLPVVPRTAQSKEDSQAGRATCALKERESVRLVCPPPPS